MARRRRRSSSRRIWVVGSLAIIAGVWSYARFVSPVLEGEPIVQSAPVGESAPVADKPPATVRPTAKPRPSHVPKLTSSRPEKPVETPRDGVTEKGEPDQRASAIPKDPEKATRAEKLFENGIKAEKGGDLLAARSYLSEAVNLGLNHQALIDARAALVRIGAATIFSGRIVDNDPFVGRYVVASGDSLSKIARKFDVTDDFLASINNITDKNMIRLGQTLKVVQGPFHARIDKKTYSMDIYLQSVFVKHYTVGLGVDGSTPTGQWVVGTKLTNPTYHPPRGGQILAADDPENPLGEHWLELKGVAGEALGQARYGIHGTIEPDSIGKSESLGCIRMHNADVAEVYTYLVSDKSQVLVE